MNDRECAGRLIASTTHELRNVLAVLRETSGLAQDLLACGTPACLEKLPKALTEAGRSVDRISALADSLDWLAQGALGQDETECDLGAAAQAFCRMMARKGKACGITFDNMPPASPPVLTPMNAFAIQLALMDVFDVCEAAGGGVVISMAAGLRDKSSGLTLEARPQSGEQCAALEKLAEFPALTPLPPRWTDRLSLGKTIKRRFWLPLAAARPASIPAESMAECKE